MSSPRNILWTPEIDIDSIAMRFNEPSGIQQMAGIVRSELNDERAIKSATFLAVNQAECLLPIALVLVRSEHLTR